MSEDRSDDDPPGRSSRDPAPSGSNDPAAESSSQASGSGDPAGEGEGPAKADGEGTEQAAPRRPRRRLAILSAALIVTIVAAVAIKWVQHRRSISTSGPVTEGSGAAKEAPLGPGLPDHPDGVRLSGHVIDGTGAPVPGAEVTAELERGAVDRALSTTPRGGAGGSGSGAGG
ncbi:MAG TPA: hypothetical protein VN253_22700, partial [Kofleriaceae bacterium]|nr:hypothetical protein [Kofleriaceae bacterium]